jgi:hypothetical protein
VSTTNPHIGYLSNPEDDEVVAFDIDKRTELDHFKLDSGSEPNRLVEDDAGTSMSFSDERGRSPPSAESQ